MPHVEFTGDDGLTYTLDGYLAGRTIRPTLWQPGEDPELVIREVYGPDGQPANPDIPDGEIDRIYDYLREVAREVD